MAIDRPEDGTLLDPRGAYTHKWLAFKPDRMIGIDATDAFSRRPLSRASRPFMGRTLKGSNGLNTAV